jgi:branched-chain amino acid aminotransferase
MLYQLSHVRKPTTGWPRVRLETIAEAGGGVQNQSQARRCTHRLLGDGQLVAELRVPHLVGRPYAGRVTTLNSTSAPVRDLRIWLEGSIFTAAEYATVSAVDHGLVVGDGVFEALKVTAGHAFAVRRHLDRLTRSARALGLPDPDHRTIRAAIDEVLERVGYEHGRLRITYTGGPGPLASTAASGPPTLILAVEPREPSPPTAAVVTARWSRNEHGALTGVKSTSYAENVRTLAYATSRDASEAILLNTAGHLCEGTGSNVFCVFGDEVVTPPLRSGPLAGVTRELLLQWCEISETDVKPDQARTADEVFLTSSMRDVQAVHRWDDVEFSAPGPRTREIAAVFARRSSADQDP